MFKCSTFSEAAHDASQKSSTERLHVPPFDSGFITVDYSFAQKSVINDFPSIQPDVFDDSLSQQNEMFAPLFPGHWDISCALFEDNSKVGVLKILTQT